MNINLYKKAFAAGALIGIAGTAYLSIGVGSVSGAMIFSAGLLSILVLQLNLYTGMVGRSPFNKSWKLIPAVLFFNFAGVAAIGLLAKPNIQEAASVMMMAKDQMSFLSLLLYAILCGAIMQICVSVYKHNNFVAIVVIPMLIATFILSGFGHSIADAFYIAAARGGYFKILGAELLGNAIGGIFTYYLVEEVPLGR